MMKTILGIGLGDESVLGPTRTTGNERFAWDSYRRLLQMYGRPVLGIAPEPFDRHGPTDDPAQLVEDCRKVIRDATGEEFPQDPGEQPPFLETVSVPASTGGASTSPTACVPPSTSWSWSSATSARPRPPKAAAPALPSPRPSDRGDYLPDAQGEDVVAGIRNAVPLAELDQAAWLTVPASCRR
jgi:pyruvate,orthophosphate dikinase